MEKIINKIVPGLLLVVAITAALVIRFNINYNLRLFYDDGANLYFKRYSNAVTGRTRASFLEEIFIYDTIADKYEAVHFGTRGDITVYDNSHIITVKKRGSNGDYSSIYMYDVTTSTEIANELLNDCLDDYVYCTPVADEYVVITAFEVGFDSSEEGSSYIQNPVSSQVRSFKVYDISSEEIISEYILDVNSTYKHAWPYSYDNYVWYEDSYYNDDSNTIKYLYRTVSNLDDGQYYTYLLYSIDLLNNTVNMTEIPGADAAFACDGHLHTVTVDDEQYYHNLYNEEFDIASSNSVDRVRELYGDYIVYTSGVVNKYNFETYDYEIMNYIDDEYVFVSHTSIINGKFYDSNYLTWYGFGKNYQYVIDIERDYRIKFSSSRELPHNDDYKSY